MSLALVAFVSGLCVYPSRAQLARGYDKKSLLLFCLPRGRAAQDRRRNTEQCAWRRPRVWHLPGFSVGASRSPNGLFGLAGSGRPRYKDGALLQIGWKVAYMQGRGKNEDDKDLLLLLRQTPVAVHCSLQLVVSCKPPGCLWAGTRLGTSDQSFESLGSAHTSRRSWWQKLPDTGPEGCTGALEPKHDKRRFHFSCCTSYTQRNHLLFCWPSKLGSASGMPSEAATGAPQHTTTTTSGTSSGLYAGSSSKKKAAAGVAPLAAQSETPPFVQWVYETYRDQLRLSHAEGSHKFLKFIRSMGVETLPLSGAVRIQSFHILKFGYPLRRAGYVAAAFLARVFASGSTPLHHETYFAYAYWPREESCKSGPPEYICHSPTFESRDGEYRHRFIWFKQFLEGYEALTPLLAPLERMLLEAVGNNELEIDLFFFPSDDKKLHGGLVSGPVSYSDEARLGVKSLAVAMALDVVRAQNGTLQNHASNSYCTVMQLLYKRCTECFSAWDLHIRNRFAVFEAGKENQPYRAQCGQKLVPLTIRESLQVNNINLAPWREVWIAQRATDLVINSIAPAFPIFNNWTYLDGADRSLFSNKAMHERYARSTQAKAVCINLRHARAAIGSAASTDHRMCGLDAHVYDAIAYAQDYVLLTELAMCSTSEYVGMTVRTIPDIARKSEKVALGFLRMFSEPAMQARYLFDLCYGAHMLHTRVGAIHVDLHLNNMTVYELGHQYYDGVQRFTNPTIAYVAGPRGEADTYVFPHDGFFACLIDFSRAILGPAARPQIEAESGKAFATSFYRGQVSRALHALDHYVSGFVRLHQEKIKGLLLAEPDTMFSVMTAIDFLAVGRNFGALLREVSEAARAPCDKRTLEVAPEGITLAARIEKIALEHLVINLTELVHGSRPREVRNAGDFILPGAFDEFRYLAWAGADPAEASLRPYPLHSATLTDVYNAAVPLEYSSTDYARYPPWANFEELGRHLGGIKIAQVTAGRGERPFLQSLDFDGYLAVLQEQVRKSIEDAPAAETSSWVAD
ncbi:BA71V-C717R [Elysia marginata]|uniref:BA71V-C717R n=1 Tax=Elysia marginata TaxID=1093978 RepID=A0AAV4GVM1_9GAST|nr:BA71V-C717R [Elysia marginata]